MSTHVYYFDHISADGFINVIRNGGSDHIIAPSKRVNIHTDNGIVKGIFGWPAIHVRKGDIVKRGQHIADGGDLVKTRCGGGMEHLHFHMSKRKGSNPNAWGTWRFLGEPSGWINPHKYWTGGVGKPECFVEGRKYPDGLLTLPVECKN